MFVKRLVEIYYLRLLGLSRIPHYTTLQKFTDRISSSLVGRKISLFIVISCTKHIFVEIYSTGFRIIHTGFSIILNEHDLEENMRNCLLEQMYYNKSYVQLR
jgi:hypothetical protein